MSSTEAADAPKRRKLGFSTEEHDNMKHRKSALTFWGDFWFLWSACTKAPEGHLGIMNTIRKRVLESHDSIRKVTKNMALVGNNVDNNDISIGHLSYNPVALVQTTKMREDVLNEWARLAEIAAKEEFGDDDPNSEDGMEEIRNRVYLIKKCVEDEIAAKFASLRAGYSNNSIIDIVFEAAEALRNRCTGTGHEELVTNLALLEDAMLALNWRTSMLSIFLYRLYMLAEQAPHEPTVLRLLKRLGQTTEDRRLIISDAKDYDDQPSTGYYERLEKSMSQGSGFENTHLYRCHRMATMTPSVIPYMLEIAEVPPTALIVLFRGLLSIHARVLKHGHRTTDMGHKCREMYSKVDTDGVDVTLLVAKKMHEAAAENTQHHFRVFYKSIVRRTFFEGINKVPQVLSYFLQDEKVVDAHRNNLATYFLNLCVWNVRAKTYVSGGNMHIREYRQKASHLLEQLVSLIHTADDMCLQLQTGAVEWMPKPTVGEDGEEVREEPTESLLRLVIKGGISCLGHALQKWEWPAEMVLNHIPQAMQMVDDSKEPVAAIDTMLSFLPDEDMENHGFLSQAVRFRRVPELFEAVLRRHKWSQDDLENALHAATNVMNKDAARTLLNAPYLLQPGEDPPRWILEIVEELFAPGGSAFEAVNQTYQ